LTKKPAKAVGRSVVAIPDASTMDSPHVNWSLKHIPFLASFRRLQP
jgi:hypothetical protein